MERLYDRLYVALTESEISVRELSEKAAAPECGAALLFLGTVRNEHEGKRVRAITYDVHPELALQALKEIALAAVAELGPFARVAVVHRVGFVKTGEPCIGISVSSPHRDEAYRASRRIIEDIKRQVPIWKKEHYETGESAWLSGTVLNREAPSR